MVLTFLIAHWWIPFVVCLILGLILTIIDDIPLWNSFPVSIVYTVGVLFSSFLWNQKYELVSKVILRH